MEQPNFLEGYLTCMLCEGIYRYNGMYLGSLGLQTIMTSQPINVKECCVHDLLEILGEQSILVPYTGTYRHNLHVYKHRSFDVTHHEFVSASF